MTGGNAGQARAQVPVDTGRATALRARLEATGATGPIRMVRAPGRVNLIGEHTDYNEGLVLPVAIDREIWIAFTPWDRGEVELTSTDLGETRSFSFDGLALEDRSPRSWVDYVAATAWSMRKSGLPTRGFRGVLDSTIPIGSGLSSSAAMEMASSWALAVPGTPRPEPGVMAAIAQRGENRYVGVNCGIMDQFASAAGKAGHALLIDCRTNTFKTTPIPAGLSLVVCETGSSRRLDESAYNTRRSECELAVRLIAEREPGVTALRDVDQAMLARNRARLPEVVARRAEHIIAENGRVLATVAALRAGDLKSLGRLFAASHASLRDLYEVSSPELDAMVDIAIAVPGVVASRMTGAGFGGCTVSLVERGAEVALREAVLAQYQKRTGLTPRVYIVAAVDGAGQLAPGS
jgi:galactokinase